MTDFPRQDRPPAPAPASEEGEARDPSIVAGISREIVRIYASHYGRGPTKAKTVWRDDVVICVLEEIFTRSEEVLVDSGNFLQVRENRQAFQDATEQMMREVVEAATGSSVVSFLSQVSPEGIASEVFTLKRREVRP